jgi:hypothetical protein
MQRRRNKLFRFYYYDLRKAISWNLIQNKKEVTAAAKKKHKIYFQI